MADEPLVIKVVYDFTDADREMDQKERQLSGKEVTFGGEGKTRSGFSSFTGRNLPAVSDYTGRIPLEGEPSRERPRLGSSIISQPATAYGDDPYRALFAAPGSLTVARQPNALPYSISERGYSGQGLSLASVQGPEPYALGYQSGSTGGAGFPAFPGARGLLQPVVAKSAPIMGEVTAGNWWPNGVNPAGSGVSAFPGATGFGEAYQGNFGGGRRPPLMGAYGGAGNWEGPRWEGDYKYDITNDVMESFGNSLGRRGWASSFKSFGNRGGFGAARAMALLGLLAVRDISATYRGTQESQTESGLADNYHEFIQSRVHGVTAVSSGYLSGAVALGMDIAGDGPAQTKTQLLTLDAIHTRSLELLKTNAVNSQLATSIAVSRNMGTDVGSVAATNVGIAETSGEKSREAREIYASLQRTHETNSFWRIGSRRERDVSDPVVRDLMQGKAEALDRGADLGGKQIKFNEDELKFKQSQEAAEIKSRADFSAGEQTNIQKANIDRLASSQAIELNKVRHENADAVPGLTIAQQNEMASAVLQMSKMNEAADIENTGAITSYRLRGQNKGYDATINDIKTKRDSDYEKAYNNPQQRARIGPEADAHIQSFKDITARDESNELNILVSEGRTTKYRLNDQPLDAKLNETRRRRDVEQARLDPSSPGYAATYGQIGKNEYGEEQEINRDFNRRNFNFNSSTAFQNQSLTAVIDRNPGGARAISTYARGDEEYRKEQQNQNPAGADLVKQRTKLELQAQQQTMLDSLRAHEVNPFATAFGVRGSGQRAYDKEAQEIIDLLGKIAAKKLGAGA